MAEYIEREAAINEQKRFCGYLDNDMLNRLEIAMRRIPAADVRPVVLCKDCVHYEMGVCLKIYDDGAANKDAWQERKPDDYCSYGEDTNAPTKESEEVSAVRCWLTNGADMREET